jgi:glycine oxidase
MSESSNVVVVGGGVIGLSVAYELLRRGRGVTVLERGEPGCGATCASAGMLAPVSEAEIECPEQIVFGRDSLARYPELIRAVEEDAGPPGCGYRQEGTLWVAVNRDEREHLDHLAETVRLKGLAAERLSRDDVLDLEPRLSGRVVGGLRVSGDHQLDPRDLTRTLVRAIRKRGGTVETGVEVEEIRAADGRVAGVVTRRDGAGPQSLDGSQVVLCAGAWSDRVRHPLERLGVRPVKGQILRLAGERLLSHVIRTPEVYFVPRDDGELLVGATVEEMGFDERPTAGAMHDILRHAHEVLPGIYDLECREAGVGLRPARESHRPAIGPTAIDGLFVAVGHYRGGILQAPATAHYLARTIVEGTTPAELEPFLPAAVTGVAR